MIAALRVVEPKLNARAGKKEGVWGEGIFCCHRFPPPPNFVPVKLARRLKCNLSIKEKYKIDN
jgi:hypothetical protein